MRRNNETRKEHTVKLKISFQIGLCNQGYLEIQQQLWFLILYSPGVSLRNVLEEAMTGLLYTGKCRFIFTKEKGH